MNPSPFRTFSLLLSFPDERILSVLRAIRHGAPIIRDWIEGTDDCRCLPLLQEEYTRLFVSAYPQLPAPPYESFYVTRTPKERIRLLERLTDWYRMHEHELVVGHPEPPDHLPVELEFAASLDEEGLRESLSRFCADHLGCWLKPLCRRVSKAQQLPVYGDLLCMVEELLTLQLDDKQVVEAS